MRRTFIVLLPFVVACGPSVPVASDGTTRGDDDDEGSAGPGPTSDPDPSTTNATTTTSASASADGSSSNGGDASSSADDDGGFLDIDGGGTSVECDIWIDDCPPGQKCMPWANDGGGSWNATKCSPLAENPNHVGEPCTVEGSGVSGIDDCEAHAMCWEVNPETNVGTCVGFCSGSEANPTCPGPCDNCTFGNSVLILCLPTCDPLAQDCSEGRACFPSDDFFACYPCCAGESGVLGDGCEFPNVCDPGLFCADADLFPGCQSDFGCCTPFCDVLANDPCPASPPGLECIPWFDEGEAPPCFDQVVGGCLLPE